MPVYIKKYTGDNYFRNRNYVDSIVISSLPADSLPRFGYETENNAAIGQYRAGDFDLRLSLTQSETSVLGLSIKDFLLGTDRDYYLLVIVVVGNQAYSGKVEAGNITGDYNYHSDGMYVTMICKDILLEWAARCGMVPNSTINWGSGTLYTFEEYMFMHFAGITSDVVLLNLPATSYLARLQPYGAPGECFAFLDFFEFITNQINISRWETFKQLALGMGFNFEMYLNPGTEVLNEPEFIFNIFFQSDLASETPITLDVLSHNDFTTAKRLEWLYFRYRYFTLSGVDYSQGILVNSDTEFYTDTDHNNGATLYPAILITLNGKLISVTNSTGGAIKQVINDVDCKEFELRNYTYDLSSGGAPGKLYPLDEDGVTGGGMAYCHIFHTTINPSRYDFNPIQRYAATQYRRYMKGLQKSKSLKVIFNDTTDIKLWKTTVLNDGAGDETYYISAVRNIDINNQTAEIELVKLLN
jgi:hypothetical protein